MQKYDVFISYRREGSENLERLLCDRLTAKGYRVFLDIESMRGGNFNEQLYAVIAGCTDMVLLLPPHALNRCTNDPGDWVRREIRHALQCGVNIIPVMMDGFDWAEAELPDDIAPVRNCQGVQPSKIYLDAMIDLLCSYLRANKQKEQSARFIPQFVKGSVRGFHIRSILRGLMPLLFLIFWTIDSEYHAEHGMHLVTAFLYWIDTAMRQLALALRGAEYFGGGIEAEPALLDPQNSLLDKLFLALLNFVVYLFPISEFLLWPITFSLRYQPEFVHMIARGLRLLRCNRKDCTEGEYLLRSRIRQSRMFAALLIPEEELDMPYPAFAELCRDSTRRRRVLTAELGDGMPRSAVHEFITDRLLIASEDGRHVTFLQSFPYTNTTSETNMHQHTVPFYLTTGMYPEEITALMEEQGFTLTRNEGGFLIWSKPRTEVQIRMERPRFASEPVLSYVTVLHQPRLAEQQDDGK